MMLTIPAAMAFSVCSHGSYCPGVCSGWDGCGACWHATVATKARKLSFKEQRELDALPDQIAAMEAEQRDIHEALLDGSLFSSDNTRALQLSARNAQIDDELMAALERWEELGRPA